MCIRDSSYAQMVKLKLTYFQYSPEIYEDVRRYIPAPVSYTHLDVYKRQDIDGSI